MAGEDTDPKSSASAAAMPYVFFSFLLEVLLQFLALVSVLRVLGSMSYKQLHLVTVLDVFTSSSYMQTMFTFSLSERMTCFISSILVMLYLVFLLIKSFGKLLIFQQFPLSSVCYLPKIRSFVSSYLVQSRYRQVSLLVP